MPFESIRPSTFMALILMPCARAIVLVRAGGADGAALLGAEEPVEQCDQHGANSSSRMGLLSADRAGHAAQRQKQAVLIHADRSVGLHAHDAQVDRIERELRQDAGKDGRDAAASCAAGR